MKQNLLFCFLSIFLSQSFISRAQQAEMLGPGIISNNGAFGLALSPDGNHALWVQSNGGRDTLYIVESFKVKGKWQAAQRASFSGNGIDWRDIDPVFTPDGKKILFQSTRTNESRGSRKDFDLWMVEKQVNGWGQPYPLSNVVNTELSESFASMSVNGDIYFTRSNDPLIVALDIYRSSLKDGSYQAPINIGSPVNTKFLEANPFIAPDGDYLLYFSNDSTGYGNTDLYLSFNQDGKWLLPINLGAIINTAYGEFCPLFHTKQKKLYFSRSKIEANGRRTENIYSIPFNIKAYKAKERIKVK